MTYSYMQITSLKYHLRSLFFFYSRWWLAWGTTTGKTKKIRDWRMLSPKWSTSTSSTSQRLGIIVEDRQKSIRDRCGRRFQVISVFRAQQGSYTYELIEIEAVFIKFMQSQAQPSLCMESGVWHTILPYATEELAIVSLSEKGFLWEHTLCYIDNTQ